MKDDELLTSLSNTAYTTGAGANCFFQGFIHTLCLQPPDVIEKMSKFPAAQKLIKVFNREVTEMKVENMSDLVLVAKTMHPLEREVIFGPLMRMTLNELELEGPEPDSPPLKLEDGSIIFPPHAIAFSHAFGFGYDEYTHKDDAEGMPDHLKDNVFKDQFYLVQHSMPGSIGTVSLRLKSCHFEVAGLTPEQVDAHQSQIQPKELQGDPNRPEQPGARFYEEPSPDSDCAIQNASVPLKEAIPRTIEKLRERPGEHARLFKSHLCKEMKARLHCEIEAPADRDQFSPK